MNRESRDFAYRDVLLKGRPVHRPPDAFSIRHPAMPLSRRAKIFSPFDALKGFGEAVASKDEIYVPKKELNEEQCACLDREMQRLRKLTANSRVCREHPVFVYAEYFCPCRDPENEAFGRLGQYEALTGICRGVDMIHRNIRIEDVIIPAEDIAALRIIDAAP